MIIVSHRGPYQFSRDDDGELVAQQGAGGIVSALSPLLADKSDATWIAAAMSDDDRAAGRVGTIAHLDVNVRLLDLDREQHRMHYEVVANGVLWFLHHGMFDRARRPRFDLRFRDAWEAFVAVNQHFADVVAQSAPAGEIVLVQDYQLCLVPGQLRAQRPDLRVVHFTHTPFAGPDDLSVLPTDVGAHLCASLASGPAGFHTRRWADAYRQSARAALGRGASIAAPFVASLGPDVAALEAVSVSAGARAAARSLTDAVGDRLVIARTDRIEPSKNIVRGFLAYDRLLEARPGLRGRVVFVAMVYPSRQGLAEYLAYESEVEQTDARVNDRWSTRDWKPILLDDRDDYARSVAGMQRYDVLLVNALRDGLNLVAKEGPVVNRRDGVLCLSPEAGAYEELKSAALRVHPYDIEQCAGVLDDALSMPLDERAGRASKLRALATVRSPADWLADLVGHAGQ
ncbi:MAG: trehalose 6-phosphate synthase [Actinomycetota bacterium]|nr:trehalose 6-phosphate synthase [Actinomycetota bacterium]